MDYCAKGHTCHANASCLNLQTTYACQCDQGFQGDGQNCNGNFFFNKLTFCLNFSMSFDLYFSYDNVTIYLDVDECEQRGGETGHYCHSNTKCVNSLGSYTCECLPGYRRLDKFNCVELDECTSGKHSCDSHAVCINTLGSYHCQCQDGYSGDGFKCERKYFSNFVSLNNNQLMKNI